MDSFTMARQTMGLKRNITKEANSAYNQLPEFQMPEMPDMTQHKETLSRGWTSLVDTITTSSIMQRSHSQSSSSNQRPPQEALASSTAASGLWQKCYDSITQSEYGIVSRLTASEDPDKIINGESHLTRVMKEYYLAKCTSQNDLPDWLFPEKQRSNTRAWSDQADNTYSSAYSAPQNHSARNPSSLRDIFDAQPARTNHDPYQRMNSVDSGYASIDSNVGRRTQDKLRSLKTDRTGRTNEIPQSTNDSQRQGLPTRTSLRTNRPGGY